MVSVRSLSVLDFKGNLILLVVCGVFASCFVLEEDTMNGVSEDPTRLNSSSFCDQCIPGFKHCPSLLFLL